MIGQALDAGEGGSKEGTREKERSPKICRRCHVKRAVRRQCFCCCCCALLRDGTRKCLRWKTGNGSIYD